MFSVKHIRKGTGLTSDSHEIAVYECRSYVISYPANPPGAREPIGTRITLYHEAQDAPGTGWAIDLSDDEEIYVMNSTGRTIDHLSKRLCEVKG